ncbi:MAG: hypothetical protein N3G76_02405 [Candidatus Micrarchaeota archaeon]|nr:hypothetical protein [Candidatus Micrarchaeota archaeon]
MRSKFSEFIMSRFGIKLSDEFVVEERTSKVYVYSALLDRLGLKVVRKGILAGKLDSIFGIKPSLDFVLVFGHLATKNCITISDDDVVRLFSGESIKLSQPQVGISDGLVILKSRRGMGIGIAYNKNGELQSLIPKDRRV